jgi:hypothetical protein
LRPFVPIRGFSNLQDHSSKQIPVNLPGLFKQPARRLAQGRPNRIACAFSQEVKYARST